MNKEGKEAKDHNKEMNTCVSEEEGIRKSAATKEQRNNGILTKAKTMCGAFEKEYKKANEAREEELNLIKALEALLQERLMSK